MIRTKYLFIAVLMCVGFIFGMGTFSMMYPASDTSNLKTEDVVFIAPQNSYTIHTEVDNRQTIEREAFISKVRSALTDDPVGTPIVAEETSSTSTSLVSSEPNATSTAGIYAEPIIGTGTPIAM